MGGMRVIIGCNSMDRASVQITRELCALLRGRGIEPCVFSEDSDLADVIDVPVVPSLRECTHIVTIGGDGTILKWGTTAAEYGLPLLGVNMGRLGFMATVEPSEVWRIPDILSGECPVSRRMLLDCEIIRGGETVLDLGSGSGILSIAALQLGAKSAAGVDIDPKAEDIARENAAMNGIGADRFTAMTANVLGDHSPLSHLYHKCDVVLANIVADVIIPLAPVVPEFLADGGTFICSGILQTRLAEVERAIAAAGLRVTERRTEDDWAALTAVRA